MCKMFEFHAPGMADGGLDWPDIDEGTQSRRKISHWCSGKGRSPAHEPTYCPVDHLARLTRGLTALSHDAGRLRA